MTEEALIGIMKKYFIESENCSNDILSAMREAMRLEVIYFEEWKMKMNRYQMDEAGMFANIVRTTEEQYLDYLNQRT